MRILVPKSVLFRPKIVQMPNLALIETKRISVCIANIVMIKRLKRKHGDVILPPIEGTGLLLECQRNKTSFVITSKNKLLGGGIGGRGGGGKFVFEK